MKTPRTTTPDSERSRDADPSPPHGLARAGRTEATRPRSRRDEEQRGPGSASADVQMTADGGPTRDDAREDADKRRR